MNSVPECPPQFRRFQYHSDFQNYFYSTSTTTSTCLSSTRQRVNADQPDSRPISGAAFQILLLHPSLCLSGSINRDSIIRQFYFKSCLRHPKKTEILWDFWEGSNCKLFQNLWCLIKRSCRMTSASCLPKTLYGHLRAQHAFSDLRSDIFWRAPW